MTMSSFRKQPSFGDLVQKFSQVHLLRSGGCKVHDVATPDQVIVDKKVVDDEEFFHEAESESLDERDELSQKVQDLEGLIANLFASITALKSAYIKLQAAHAPYDPEKLQLADKAVILELRNLSDCKRLFREKQKNKSSGIIPTSSIGYGDEGLENEIQKLQSAILQKEQTLELYKTRVEDYKKELENRNVEIKKLQCSLGKMSATGEKLQRHIRKVCLSEKSSNGLVSDQCAMPRLFELVVEEAKDATFNFVDLLMNLMTSARWDLDAAANSIQPGITYANPHDKKFAFASYVCHRMFSGFDNEHFYINASLSSIIDLEKHRHECLLQFQDMRSMDPLDLVSINPDCLFGKFCHKKYLLLVHEKMEESFFSHLQHRAKVLKGGHPCSGFYQSFLRLAKSVWLVHRLGFSFSPAVKIFQVRRNVVFHPAYMDSVVDNFKLREEDTSSSPKVGLTVIPGFCFGKSIIKCQVYLDTMISK